MSLSSAGARAPTPRRALRPGALPQPDHLSSTIGAVSGFQMSKCVCINASATACSAGPGSIRAPSVAASHASAAGLGYELDEVFLKFSLDLGNNDATRTAP